MLQAKKIKAKNYFPTKVSGEKILHEKKPKDLFMDALLTDKFVSSVPTSYDVDAYLRESRGYEKF